MVNIESWGRLRDSYVSMRVPRKGGSLDDSVFTPAAGPRTNGNSG